MIKPCGENYFSTNSILIYNLFFLKTIFKMERTTGVEPVLSPWQGDVLPLYDARAYGGPDGNRTRVLRGLTYNFNYNFNMRDFSVMLYSYLLHYCTNDNFIFYSLVSWLGIKDYTASVYKHRRGISMFEGFQLN